MDSDEITATIAAAEVALERAKREAAALSTHAALINDTTDLVRCVDSELLPRVKAWDAALRKRHRFGAIEQGLIDTFSAALSSSVNTALHELAAHRDRVVAALDRGSKRLDVTATRMRSVAGRLATLHADALRCAALLSASHPHDAAAVPPPASVAAAAQREMEPMMAQVMAVHHARVAALVSAHQRVRTALGHHDVMASRRSRMLAALTAAS